uniref:Caspase 10, apoptosis-related cysteine peptidase n=1 Tax=Sinocyclocheilus rhinocerous TaxID=307959 RepID=A0A673HEL4_9TELE
MDLEFQRVLLKVQESLTGDEVQDLVFLCSDLLSLKDLSTVSSAGQLFSLLEKRNQLSCEDPSLLLELLRIMKRNSLIRNLTSDDYKQTNGTTYSQQISPYRQLLYELSESICEQDLKNIKFLLLKTLSRKKLEKDTTLLQLFLDMEKEDLLGEHNLDVLQKIIADINPSLEKRIIQYKTERYERERGFCLIINNYDFSACTLGNREGTDIDKGYSDAHVPTVGLSAVDRGQHGHPDWSAAMQPHTQQTVMHCVLSYSSLSVGSDHTGQPSLPTRINPVASSPRGIDLLSILTQVNSDVSKKTDKSGLRKQMPQPEFTLTKRVVFPPPKTHRPLP